MATPPYDIVNTIMNAARTRLNDKVNTLSPVGGKILDNTQPFSQQMVNNAWRKLQEFLADLGYTGLKQEIIFINVAPVSGADPITQVNIGYNGYFNGASTGSAPALPQNMITPYDLWERPTGTSNNLTEMDRIVNGLPSVPHIAWNRLWEWRDDTLYMPGALIATDIRLRFMGYLADFVDTGGNPWYTLAAPIMRCQDSFADYICREFCVARMDMDGAMAFQMSAEKEAREILDRDIIQPASTYKASEYGKMRDSRTPAKGTNSQSANV